MEERTYVGLDLSKTCTMATAVDPLGHRIRQEKLGVSDVSGAAELARNGAGKMDSVIRPQEERVWGRNHPLEVADSSGTPCL